MGNNVKIRTLLLIPILLVVCGQIAVAQNTDTKSLTASDPEQVLQLDQIAESLKIKTAQRDQLSQLISGSDAGSFTDEREKLIKLNEDILTLRSSFELLVLSDLNIDILNDTNQEYDWQNELLDVVAPLLDSLKSLTQKPRQIAALRELNEVLVEKIELADNALQAIATATQATTTDTAKQRLENLADKWNGDKQIFQRQLTINQAQLTKLTQDDSSVLNNVSDTIKQFFLGRGLTIVFAISAGLIAWVCARFLWWFCNTYLTTKKVRRKSTWFRLLSYSYYLFTVLLVGLSVLIVLYLREDLLLLAIAFLAIAGAVLGLRQMIPQYVKEVRLLLNVGAVREDEITIYNGIPWIVSSLNISSILHNPALHGVLRLPLAEMANLISRPPKDTLLFPTKKSDYVILPDGTFGQIAQQTPNMVEVIVRGGMSVTYPTDQFYGLSIINLSRNETFGVNAFFGFDYEQQGISLSEIPAALRKGLDASLEKSGYSAHVKSIVVDLKEAGASSIDFLIFITLDSRVASDYYKIERLIQQTCIAASNEHGWSIPFPQMTIHKA